MKAIIPVAGAGTKLRPFTYTQPKPLIPVAGKPIIAFILDQMIESGMKEFIFVIGYLGDKIKDYLEEAYPNIQKEYVHQNDRQGLGQAILSCSGLIGEGQDVLIQLGDTILDIDLQVLMNSKHHTLAVRKVSDPRSFGVVELDEEGQIKKLVEKPQIPKSNLALVGLYFIKNFSSLKSALEHNIKNNLRTRGEFHLTDGLMQMILQGEKMGVMEVKNWFDCGKKEQLLKTNATLLARREDLRKAMPCESCIIIPPVIIGRDCEIKHSILGPNVTIGEGAKIDYSILSNSIIGNYTILQSVVLDQSIIGNDAMIKGSALSYNIGDNTEIDLGGLREET
ncbi:MAG: NTP transferase domain-containing protein [Saprospiraceae bacterium]|nr:NTP transferase domain-containing protein [Saprospiraceae bacterium]